MLSKASLPRFVALSLALPAVASAQILTGPTVQPAPETVLAAFGLEAGGVQDLAVAPDGADGLQFVVTIDGQAESVRMRPHDVRSPDVRLQVRDAAGNITQIPTPPSVTYRGSVVGRPASQVALAYYDGGLRGMVWMDTVSPAWGIDPVADVDAAAAASAHVVFRTDWLLEQGECGVTTFSQLPAPSTPLDGFDVLEVAEIAIECDQPYMSQRGNNTTTAQNNVTAVMNAVNVIYERDVEIEHTISNFLFSIGSDPYTTNNVCGGNPDLLGQFASWWASNQGSVQRDVTHLFSGRNFSGSTIGCAVTPSICSNSSSYGVSDHITVQSTSGRTGLVAHELGHNWSSSHCSGGDCRIMCPGLGGCTGDISRFGQASINQILSYKATRPCLDSGAPPTLSGANPSSVPVLNPGMVQLTGTNLSSVTEVRMIGAFTTDFTVVNDTTILFEPPTPIGLGSQFVWVVGAGQSSNFITIDFQVTDPPDIRAAFTNVFALSQPYEVGMGGTPGDFWFLFLSVGDATTSNVLGFDFLVNSFYVTDGGFDTLGLAQFSFLRTDPALSFITVYAEALIVDQGLTSISATPIASTLFL